MTQDQENRGATLADIDRVERKLTEKLTELSTEVKEFNTRFTNYQQATQWVVQLAFALIASATITVIVSAVFKK